MVSEVEVSDSLRVAGLRVLDQLGVEGIDGRSQSEFLLGRDMSFF